MYAYGHEVINNVEGEYIFFRPEKRYEHGK